MQTRAHSTLMGAAAAMLAIAAPASAASIVALTADGKLVTFDTGQLIAGKSVAVDIPGKLIGIDVRPSDQKLYGVTEKGVIFTIDPKTGKTVPMSQLGKPFDAGSRAVIDFNPVADRLRMLGANGTSYRVNVVTGEVAVDKNLNYGGKDDNTGKQPNVTAGAYTNSTAGAKGTELINLDTGNGALVLQSPPNDGVLQTRGKIEFSPRAAFDIALTGTGENIGYVLDQGMLYRVGLATGGARELGKVAGLPAVLDIAVLAEP